MRQLVAALVMRFVDRVSAPARTAARAIGDINKAQEMGKRASERWAKGLDALDDRLDRLAKFSLVTDGLGRAGDAMIRPLAAATREGAAFERGMTGLGITAQLTDRQLAPLRQNIIDTAAELGALPAVVQATYSAVLAEGAYRTEADLARAGRAVARFQKLAETMRDPLSDNEAGGLTAALGGTMGIKAGDLDRALAMANRSAQQGGVGLGVLGRNMPAQIGAMSGLSFANDVGLADLLTANQIAKRLAGSSDQAANNVSNLFAAMASPETIRRFKEAGVNIEAEIKRGVQRGVSPLETLASITKRLTGGDQFRVGELFGDRQARDAIMALVLNLDDFRTMSQELKGDEVLAAYLADLERAASDNAASFERYASSMSRAGIAAGTILAPAVSLAADVLGRVAGWMSKAAESGNPLARVAVYAVAGFAGLAVAAGAVGQAVMGILGPWFIMKALFGDLGRAAVAGTFARIAGMIGKARLAMIGFNIATLANPIGLAVAAVVVAVGAIALVVRKYWGPIKAFMTGLGQGIGEAFAPMGAMLAPLAPVWNAITGAVSGLFGWVGRLIQPVRATEAQLAGATSAGRAFGRNLALAFKIAAFPITALVALARVAFRVVRSFFSWSPVQFVMRNWRGMGAALINGLMSGITSRIEAARRMAGNAVSSIATAVKNRLGIRSPSRVFAEIGDYTMQGLAVGIDRGGRHPLARAAAMAGALAGAFPAGAGGALIGAAAVAGAAGSASAAPPAQIVTQTVHQTFHINGAGQDAKAIARELHRLAQAGQRRALNDGDAR